MHTFYIIVPALSLLNMGVNGATIANTLSSRRDGKAEGTGPYKLRGMNPHHDRQIHTADFRSGASTDAEPSNGAPAVSPRQLGSLFQSLPVPVPSGLPAPLALRGLQPAAMRFMRRQDVVQDELATLADEADAAAAASSSDLGRRATVNVAVDSAGASPLIQNVPSTANGEADEAGVSDVLSTAEGLLSFVSSETISTVNDIVAPNNIGVPALKNALSFGEQSELSALQRISNAGTTVVPASEALSKGLPVVSRDVSEDEACDEDTKHARDLSIISTSNSSTVAVSRRMHGHRGLGVTSVDNSQATEITLLPLSGVPSLVRLVDGANALDGTLLRRWHAPKSVRGVSVPGVAVPAAVSSVVSNAPVVGGILGQRGVEATGRLGGSTFLNETLPVRRGAEVMSTLDSAKSLDSTTPVRKRALNVAVNETEPSVTASAAKRQESDNATELDVSDLEPEVDDTLAASLASRMLKRRVRRQDETGAADSDAAADVDSTVDSATDADMDSTVDSAADAEVDPTADSDAEADVDSTADAVVDEAALDELD